MKKNGILLWGLLVAGFIVFAGCGNATKESNTTANEQPEENSAALNEQQDQVNADNREKSSNDSGTTEMKEENDTGDSASSSEQSVFSKRDNERENMNKEEYLQKLNEMEEIDRHLEPGTTMVELVEQETERYEKWDLELNIIYGILKEQLDQEQMDELREEQRDWIEQRGETAKESSLQYEGGSSESLEYVATQASLTRERCYALVAKYMN